MYRFLIVYYILKKHLKRDLGTCKDEVKADPWHPNDGSTVVPWRETELESLKETKKGHNLKDEWSRVQQKVRDQNPCI